MRWRSALLGALVVVPLLVVLALGFGQDPHAVPSVLQGRAAPHFALQSLAGTTIDLDTLRGKPVVINFWATWCYPCKAEHDLLQDAAMHYGDKVQFLGVIYQDRETNVRQYMHGRPDHYPQLFDPGSRVAIDYGVAGVPESYLITAQGTIAYKHAGVLTPQLLHQYLDAWTAQGSQPTDAAKPLREGTAP